MIMEWVGGVRVHQCEQADPSVFANYSQCCSASLKLTSQCDWAGLPDFDLWGFSCAHTFGTPLSWQDVKDEIDAGRPFAFSWSITQPTSTATPNFGVQGSSHMMIVIGYVEGTGPKPVQTLHCLNPKSFDPTEDFMVPFEHYEGGPGTTATGVPVIYDHEHNYSVIQVFP